MKNLFLLLLLLLGGCSDDERNLLEFSFDMLTFTFQESTKEVVVKSNSSWYILNQLPSWITIETTQGESGSSSIVVKVLDNMTGESRRHTVIIANLGDEKRLDIVQKPKEKLCINGRNTYRVAYSVTQLSVEVNSNVDYKLIIPSEVGEWIKYIGVNDGMDNLIPFIYSISQSPNGDFVDMSGNSSIDLEIAENREREERYAEVVISNERLGLSDTLYIIQEAGGDTYEFQDGEYLQLQQATRGNGVNLIMMGDGFTRKDLLHGGRYENIMRQAANYFFTIEPYQSYRDYFNIYMVVAESEESGVSINNTFGSKINNKFSTAFGDGTSITCNDDLCFEYARKVKELPTDKPLIIIMPLNSTKYAGTTYLYSNGNSIALCPMSVEASPNDFEGLIHHEAGGHGFGFLCDEYIYYDTQMPESRKRNLREWQKLGFQYNLDFTNDLSSILWKDFIGIDKYVQVGAYEGGYEYQYGVWRSEANSCMNNNIPYFNVQSRWSIVTRIMKLAEMDFSVQNFIETDCVTSWYDTARSATSETVLPPLGNPIWIE